MARMNAVQFLLVVFAAPVCYVSARSVRNADFDIYSDPDAHATNEGFKEQIDDCGSKHDNLVTSESLENEVSNAIYDDYDVNATAGDTSSDLRDPNSMNLAVLKCLGRENFEECAKYAEWNKILQDDEDNGHETLSECTGISYSESVAPRILEKLCQKLRQNDRCYLPYISYTLPSENQLNDRRFDIVLNKGLISGMPNFGVAKSVLGLMLKWKELRVHYTLTVNERGKKTATEIDLLLPPVFMSVSTPLSGSSSVAMSGMDELELTDPALLTSVAERVVDECLKPRIQHILNYELRNFLFSCFMAIYHPDRTESCACSFSDVQIRC